MLIRHSALYAAGKLLPGLLGMATTALLTRLLDPAAYGLYGLALVVATFGSTLLFDWLGLAFLRFAQRDAAVIGTIVGMFATLSALTALAAFAAWAMGWFTGPAGPAVAAGLLLMVCLAGFELAARVPVACFKPRRFLWMNAGRALLSLAGAAGAAWLTRDPAWTVCATALGALGGTLLGGATPHWPKVDPALARRITAFGLPLAASMALSAVATSGVRGLLEALDSAEALGLYTAAFLLVQNTLSVVAAGIASAGYSAAIRLSDRGDALGARRQVTANWSLLLAVLAPMALGMALTAPGIAALLVGPHYVAGVATLTPWLAGAGLFAGLRAHGLDHAFQLAERPGALAAVSAVAAVLAVGLTILLTPQYGPVGAAAASLVAATSSWLLALTWGRRVWPVHLPVAAAWRVGVACAAMAASVSAVPGGLFAQMAAGVVTYAAACLALDVLGVRSALAPSARLENGPAATLPPR